jgi:hypothetical protein
LPRSVPLLALVAIYIAIRAQFWQVPPIWDGQWNFTALLEAVEVPFDPLNYTVEGHVSQGVFFPLALCHPLFKRDHYVFNICLTAFGALSAIAFYQILSCLATSLSALEIFLVTCALSFHPSVLASMIHFNFDQGTMTYFLWHWLLLLKRRFVGAWLFGILLLFSKETALMLLPLPSIFCIFTQERALRAGWIRQNIGPLITCYLAFGAFLCYKGLCGVPAVWNHPDEWSPSAVLSNYLGPSLQSFLGLIFVLNFNWVFWACCYVLAICLIIRAAPQNPHTEAKALRQIVILFLITLFTLTLVRPFSTVRYVILLFPIAFLGFGLLLSLGVASQGLRVSIISGLLVLFAFQNVRTLDPGSRAFFGTFAFGDHEMLHITRRTGECCGFGRDQIVYNLEFLRIPQLLDQVMADLKPTSNTVILADDAVSWKVLGQLSSRFQMTFQTNDGILPRYSSVEDMLDWRRLPHEAYYIVFPNCDSTGALERLGLYFKHRKMKSYCIEGYEIDVAHFFQ